MNKDIQPKVYKDCVVTYACGNTFTTISTEEKISVDICSACHPFYTGKQKFVDTEGRIEKFKKKMDLAKSDPKGKKTKRSKSGKAEEAAKKANPEKRKTLKEMLEEAQKGQE